MYDLYYSQSAAVEFGYAIYETESGEHVKVTNAVPVDWTGENKYSWPDTKYVGRGARFVSSHNIDPFGVMGIDATTSIEEIRKSCERMLSYAKKKIAERNQGSNLLRKDKAWYSQFGWHESDDLPYVWPVQECVVCDNYFAKNGQEIVMAIPGDLDPNATDKCDFAQFSPMQRAGILNAMLAIAAPDGDALSTIMRTDDDNTPKVGTYVGMEKHKHSLRRNDPCHCGSGSKFKKCCMGKENMKNS